MKKRVAFIILFIVVIFLTMIILDSTNTIDLNVITNSRNNEDKNLVKNTNENVIKDAKLKGLDLTNISLTYLKGTGSTFSVSLTNNTDNIISVESFNITFKDDSGNTIAVIAAYVGGNIDPKQVNSIKVTAKEDLSKAYSVEYSEN